MGRESRYALSGVLGQNTKGRQPASYDNNTPVLSSEIFFLNDLMAMVG